MSELEIEVIQELAKNLSGGRIREILRDNKNCSQNELINIILCENDNLSTADTSKISFDSIGAQSELIFTTECENPTCAQENCFNFHNPKQKRRDLLTTPYKSIPCRYVFRNNYWENPQVCKQKDNCKFCHTKNELKYHPNSKDPEILQNFEKISSSILNNFLEESKLPKPKDLNNTIPELKQEILSQQQKLDSKKNSLQTICQNISKLQKNLCCVVCHHFEFKFIYLYCGHPVCNNCRSLSVCPKCRVPSPLIPLNL